MKEKLQKLLEAKKNQRSTLFTSMIDCENKEERQALKDTISSLDSEIATVEGMIADADKPVQAEPQARGLDIVGSMQTAEIKPNASEERAKKFVETKKITVDATEARSVLLSTGTIAKPEGVGGINNPFNTLSSIVDMVRVEDMTGMGSHKEAYITAWQEASAKTDGTAQSGSDPTFKTCNIAPFLLGVTTYVSRELRKQTPLQYEAKVREGALIALKKKLANWIVSGDGSNEIYGIINAVNTDQSNNAIYDTLDMTGNIDEKTLRKIVFAYGGNENVGSNATLILNKKDLVAFGDVRGTNEKKAVYEIIPDGSNPNTGIIKDGGLSVPYVICSDVASYKDATATADGVKTMIYGDLRNYKLGLFGNYEIRVSEDYKFAEGLDTVLGEVMVGGNIIADKGFVVCLKKTA